MATGVLAFSAPAGRASPAYGSINNFDVVNDNGVPCHGFEIELDDLQSRDITYTYDWNHYGAPQITQDNTDPLHPKVFVRYESVKTNGVWAAFTAVPSGPIAPTQGHQFTNPSINFGGEHFGVGFRVTPSAIRYFWLIDGGGVLIHGTQVTISTPSFTYVPPAAGVPAQVQAAIIPPQPPAPPPLEFGAASWVKEIRTTTHNNTEVKLRNLISPDPDYPGLKDWRNNEPDEVEVEWQILQTDYFASNGGANGLLQGAAEGLPNGDEVITRRYEFYQYLGPLDPETGEALATTVAGDGIHGTGTNSNTVVVGLYLGAQMSAFDVEAPLGLVDHVPDAEVGVSYDVRSVVIAGTTSFVATVSGSLPNGMNFDTATGELSGTPTVAGVFVFQVTASSSNNPVVTKEYPMMVAPAGVVLPPHSTVDVSVSPAGTGSASGTGVYTNGNTATVLASPSAGFGFLNWTENGVPVSNSAQYQFTVSVNQALIANFVPQLMLSLPQANTLALHWPTNSSGFVLQQNPDLATTNWVTVTNGISVTGDQNQLLVTPLAGKGFFRLLRPF